jgi:predicted transcriptional regulator
VRDIAAQVGISDRAVQGILGDLVDAGHVVRQRRGRRNVYRVRSGARFRHPLERGVRLGDFLALLPPRDEP